MAEELGTFDIDPKVVTGWKNKSSLREADLSKFVPLGKLFAVLKKGDSKKGENRGFEIQINGYVSEGTKRVRIEEVGQVISQTQDKIDFRGGIGITEISTKYTSIEAGAMEVRVGVIVSNFEQLSYAQNKSAVHMFYPGKEFLLVYGWQTDIDTVSLFPTNGNSVPIVDLENFDNGRRRYLYCTLHHFEWNFGDQGRIYGVLTFWSPDTVRLSLLRTDRHVDEIMSILNDQDMQQIYDAFSNDVAEYDQYSQNQEKPTNQKVLEDLYNLTLIPVTPTVSVDQPIIRKTHRGVGVLTSKLPYPVAKKENQINEKGESQNESVFRFVNPFDPQTERIYLGWILETIKFVNNSNSSSKSKNIYIRYKDVLPKKTKINFTYFKDNIAKKESSDIDFHNVFFVPVHFQTIINYIANFKGSLKFFLDSLLQKVNEEFEGLISLTLKMNGNICEIDDFREKSISKSQNVISPDGKSYRSNHPNTPVLTYGFANSLVYSVKISSTIPPDIIWAQGLTIDMSDEDAAKLLNNIVQKEEKSNPQFKTIYEEYMKAKVEASDQETQFSDEGQLVVPSLNPSQAKQVLVRSFQRDNTLPVLIMEDAINTNSIDLGTVMRNYFNGLTITLHGTTGFQAFKSFLFKGFELLTSHQGIDGLYSIIMVNDVVNPKGFQTILEARRINSLPII